MITPVRGPAVVAVILNWNGRDDTLRCVESLVDDVADQVLLVVDNGSYDGVLEAVSRRWPDVATLQTGSNLGFAGGMNAGIRWALAHDAQAVAVINNDVVCPPRTLSRLLEVLPAHGGLSPEVHYLDDPDQVWFGAGTVDWNLNWPHHLQGGTDLPEIAGRLRPSEILAGCFIVAPAEVWRLVGLFDERYFLIFEDSDWSVRANAAGVQLAVDTDTLVHHRVSASFTGATAFLGSFYYLRNGLLFGSLWGRHPSATWRFVRHRILPQLWTLLRERDVRGFAQRIVIFVWAAAAFLTRRHGRAPHLLERLVGRWNRHRIEAENR